MSVGVVAVLDVVEVELVVVGVLVLVEVLVDVDVDEPVEEEVFEVEGVDEVWLRQSLAAS